MLCWNLNTIIDTATLTLTRRLTHHILQVPGRGQTPHNCLLHQGAGVAWLGRVWSSDDHQGFPHLQVWPQDLPPSQPVHPLGVGEDELLAPHGGDTGQQFEVRSNTVIQCYSSNTCSDMTGPAVSSCHARPHHLLTQCISGVRPGVCQGSLSSTSTETVPLWRNPRTRPVTSSRRPRRGGCSHLTRPTLLKS